MAKKFHPFTRALVAAFAAFWFMVFVLFVITALFARSTETNEDSKTDVVDLALPLALVNHFVNGADPELTMAKIYGHLKLNGDLLGFDAARGEAPSYFRDKPGTTYGIVVYNKYKSVRHAAGFQTFTDYSTGKVNSFYVEFCAQDLHNIICDYISFIDILGKSAWKQYYALYKASERNGGKTGKPCKWVRANSTGPNEIKPFSGYMCPLRDYPYLCAVISPKDRNYTVMAVTLFYCSNMKAIGYREISINDF